MARRPLTGIIAAAAIALCLIFSVSCGKSSTGLPSSASAAPIQNQIFKYTSSLEARATDFSTGQPYFSWTATNRKHVVAAVFSEHLSVSENRIRNPEKVVWIWHSGLNKGREGNVQFTDGLKSAETLASAATLASGTYYWAVWAFDDEGVPAVSTTEMTLVIP